MNEHDVEDSLKREGPPPSATAKRRALQAAMAEFKQQAHDESLHAANTASDTAQNKKFSFFQGFLNWLRPTDNTNNSRSFAMMLSKSQYWAGAGATCAVALVGFFWFKGQPLPTVEHSPTAIYSPDSSSTDVDSALAKTPPKEGKKDQHLAEEVVVSGIRQSLEPAPDVKREARSTVGEIASADIASPPKGAAAYEPGPQAMVAAKPSRALPVSPQANSKIAAGFTAPPPQDLITQQPQEYRDRFEFPEENAVKVASEHPVSTFSIDVDTASYSFVRRTLNQGRLPPKQAVRTEEMINYFDYNYPSPSAKSTPFKPSITVLDSPWKSGNKLVHIGIKGYDISPDQQPDSNLVFLLDVSGSMSSQDKLPLVKQSMEMLLNTLKPSDTVSIVVYAGAAGAVLDPTPVKEKTKIMAALTNLQAGGSTAGGAGLSLAYQLAEANFKKGAVNRILLATDGDFNVGHTGDADLKTFVERKRDKGIFLSVLGFGQGNYQDALMQTLAQSGNGIATYIDTLSEAQKVLVQEATSTLFPIAKDVKIQVEFNPATVKEYRLIGYETRALKREDFNNDKVDAGDIGAGHTVTAIYEITPVGQGQALIDDSRYQTPRKQTDKAKNAEYGFLKMRYKLPDETDSRLISQAIPADNTEATSWLPEVHFSTAVAGFAQLLKSSAYVGGFDYDKVINLAQANKGADEFGYRTEFIQLVRKAKIAKAL